MVTPLSCAWDRTSTLMPAASGVEADVPPKQFVVHGHVYRDLNGDGIFNQDD